MAAGVGGSVMTAQGEECTSVAAAAATAEEEEKYMERQEH